MAAALVFSSLLLLALSHHCLCVTQTPYTPARTPEEEKICSETLDKNSKEYMLYRAINRNNPAWVLDMIKQGANVSAREFAGVSLLQSAAYNGNLQICQMLIKAGAEVNTQDCHLGFTPLHNAVRRNFPALAELLLQAGADPNVATVFGDKPLSLAVNKGNLNMIKMLVHYGANPNINLTSIQVAEEIQNWLSSQNCSSYKNILEPVLILYQSSESGNTTAVRCLIASGVNVSASIAGGYTPLRGAVNSEHLHIARMLIKAGANVNTSDSLLAFTPLHAAVANGDKRMVNLLLKYGANINATTVYKATPLQIATSVNTVPVAEVLLDKGANVNSTDIFNNTPLHIAAYRGYMEMVQLLVKKGADLNAKTMFKQTPEQLALDQPNVLAWLRNQRQGH